MNPAGLIAGASPVDVRTNQLEINYRDMIDACRRICALAEALMHLGAENSYMMGYL